MTVTKTLFAPDAMAVVKFKYPATAVVEQDKPQMQFVHLVMALVYSGKLVPPATVLAHLN